MYVSGIIRSSEFVSETSRMKLYIAVERNVIQALCNQPSRADEHI